LDSQSFVSWWVYSPRNLPHPHVPASWVVFFSFMTDSNNQHELLVTWGIMERRKCAKNKKNKNRQDLGGYSTFMYELIFSTFW
jgi:hypothetical protein